MGHVVSLARTEYTRYADRDTARMGFGYRYRWDVHGRRPARLPHPRSAGDHQGPDDAPRPDPVRGRGARGPAHFRPIAGQARFHFHNPGDQRDSRGARAARGPGPDRLRPGAGAGLQPGRAIRYADVSIFPRRARSAGSGAGRIGRAGHRRLGRSPGPPRRDRRCGCVGVFQPAQQHSRGAHLRSPHASD